MACLVLDTLDTPQPAELKRLLSAITQGNSLGHSHHGTLPRYRIGRVQVQHTPLFIELKNDGLLTVTQLPGV